MGFQPGSQPSKKHGKTPGAPSWEGVPGVCSSARSAQGERPGEVVPGVGAGCHMHRLEDSDRSRDGDGVEDVRHDWSGEIVRQGVDGVPILAHGALDPKLFEQEGRLVPDL